MFNLKDINHEPTIEEIERYIDNTAFNELLEHLNSEYKALYKVQFSKDVWFPGWNIKCRKAGKSLCVIYPYKGYFKVLIVIGQKEKQGFDLLFRELSKEMQSIYNSTKEGMGQRWMMYDIQKIDDIYFDTLKLIKLRRNSK